MKKQFKIPIYIVTFFLLLLFFTFVHEMLHIIVSLAFGNPLVEVIFKNILENNFFTFGVGLVFNHINDDAILWVAISGSIGTIIIGILFIILAIKKRSMFLTSIGSYPILQEFIYWTIGSYYNIGDPYVLFWSLEYQFNISINTFNFYLFFLISTIIIVILYGVIIFQVAKLKGIDIYGK